MADEKEFIIITKAKDLAFHTYDMTTARRFPKRHGKLAVDLMEFAREIVVHIQDANELDVQDAGEFRERRYEQKQALSRCKDMLFLIELAERKNLISTTQCAAWTKYAVEVKRMTASWRKKDLERFTESRQRGNAPRRGPMMKHCDGRRRPLAVPARPILYTARSYFLLLCNKQNSSGSTISGTCTQGF